jgi:hypothetical protein
MSSLPIQADSVYSVQVEHDEFVADYAWFQRDLEGNSPERTTHDPIAFTSEKTPNVGADAQVKSVVTTESPDGSTTTVKGYSTDPAQPRTSHHHDVNPAEMHARGRGEGGIHNDDLEMRNLTRKESDRDFRIRGDEFNKIEGTGRGHGGVPDRDNAL